MAGTAEVRITRRVLAGGTTRHPGDTVALPLLESFVIVCECSAGEFVNKADRARAVEAQRKENNRICGPARGMAASPWQPVG
jgi:hypothetical protein